MAAKVIKKPVRSPKKTRQTSLFLKDLPSAIDANDSVVLCDIVPIEKRRDGKTRYWCRAHRADATAKYGRPLPKCKLADATPTSVEVQTLDLDKYRGGVALWGAAPSIYDTTRLPVERGIHVHARPTPQSEKEIDFTFHTVRIVGKQVPGGGIIVNQIDAIYFLISTVFGLSTKFVACTYCGCPHLDKDFFSVHPHRKHLCAGCGRHFQDDAKGIGNPIVGVREACGAARNNIVGAKRNLKIKQEDYPGGIQIWGSNPAFLWTQSKDEQEGIHVHAYRKENSDKPAIDETFGKVNIDGIGLDASTVRVLMAQKVLPLLKNRTRSANCPNCDHAQFDSGASAYTPSQSHTCSKCGTQFSTPGRLRNTVLNPLPATLANLAKFAIRPPQIFEEGLPSEMA